MFNILFGLDQEYEGEYTLFNQNAKEYSLDAWARLRESKIGLVFQDYKLLEDFTVLKLEQQVMHRFRYRKYHERIRYWFKINFAWVKWRGEAERSFARAAIKNPKILLLDEPTGNLDGLTSQLALNIYKNFGNRGILIFYITHDREAG